MKQDKDGNEKGYRLDIFDYSCLNILSIPKYEALIRAEIARVLSLSPTDQVKQKWVGWEERPKGSIWMDDSVDRLKGIGLARLAKLESIELKTVKDIANLDDHRLKEIQKMTGIGVACLKTYREEAKTASAGTSCYPKPFDWIKGNSNPYQARYGVKWRELIKKNSRSGLTRVRCVKELVEHIDSVTKKAFENTPYKDNYYWAHDSLKQMTEATCVQWMKDEGYYDRWIKPELECNDVVVTNVDGKVKKTTTYKGRPVGDQPELMPLDASLNWDIDCSLDMHVLLTSHLERDHPMKFRKDTPKRISEAIHKIYDPINGVAPSSKRIVEDVKRVLTSIKAIVEAGGKVVPGLVNRNGHRRKETAGRKYYPKKKTQVIKTMTQWGIFKDVQKIALQQAKDERAIFDKKSNKNLI